jgi:hypothetical protein
MRICAPRTPDVLYPTTIWGLLKGCEQFCSDYITVYLLRLEHRCRLKKWGRFTVPTWQEGCTRR